MRRADMRAVRTARARPPEARGWVSVRPRAFKTRQTHNTRTLSCLRTRIFQSLAVSVRIATARAMGDPARLPALAATLELIWAEESGTLR
jgi:hypothetical protein